MRCLRLDLEDLIKWLQLITLLVVGICGILFWITLAGLGPDLLDTFTTILKIEVFMRDWSF